MKNEGLEIYSRFLRRKRIALAVAALIAVVTAILSVRVGPISISLPEIFKVFAGKGEPKFRLAIMNIRLPRAVTSLLVGSALAAAGAVMQCVLRNPLASASSLGVSQGAAFGAALGIVAFGAGEISTAKAAVAVTNPFLVTIFAFVFGMASSVVILGISRFKRDVGPAGLILAGTALGSLFSGGSALLQFFADDTKLGAIVFWTFGNLGSTDWREILIVAVVFVGAMLYFLFNRWNYNAIILA